MAAPRGAPISREGIHPGPAAMLSAAGITHAFFGNPVLTDVAIEVHGGSIHALLGENGAGKSTLIGILSGGLRPDNGTVVVGGESHTRLTPALAQRFGIAVVHQELSLAPHLSVAENVVLGRVPRRAGLIDYAAIAREVSAIFADLDLDVPLAAPAETLPLGTRQLVEIAKALYRKPRLLILDEPTSSLTAVEVTRLKRVMASQSLAGVDGDTLVRLMVGRDPGDLFPRFASTAGEPLLEVQGLQSRRLTDIGFTLRRGEVLGLGGLIGQGQEDLLLSLFGAEAHRVARLALDGRPVAVPNVRAAARLGIAYVPSDRKVEGLHLPQSLHFNLVLPTIRMIARHSLRRPAVEKSRVAALLQRFAVRGGSAADRAIQLSGGNQQKIAIAKWLPLNPRVLLLNDPTRGVDVETKRELYLMLRQLAAAGTSIILASSDTPELVELCDRVLVLADGRIRVALERGALSEEAIVSAALGAGGGGGAARVA